MSDARRLDLREVLDQIHRQAAGLTFAEQAEFRRLSHRIAKAEPGDVQKELHERRQALLLMRRERLREQLNPQGGAWPMMRLIGLLFALFLLTSAAPAYARVLWERWFSEGTATHGLLRTARHRNGRATEQANRNMPKGLEDKGLVVYFQRTPDPFHALPKAGRSLPRPARVHGVGEAGVALMGMKSVATPRSVSQVCVGIPQRELGVEPETETKQLYQEILRQRSSGKATR